MWRYLPLLLTTILLLNSCYTEVKRPDKAFTTLIARQAALDTSLSTTIVLIPKKYTYGRIRPVRKLSGSFYIKNTGNKDFRIVSVNSNCDCIKTRYSAKNKIPPNDSLKIFYEMDIENVSGVFRNTVIAIGNCQSGNQTYYFEGIIN